MNKKLGAKAFFLSVSTVYHEAVFSHEIFGEMISFEVKWGYKFNTVTH